MKLQLTFLPLLFFGVLSSCEPSVERQVVSLHEGSRQVEKEVAPKLEQLIQERNSIDIQGRALTPEEIEFGKQVVSLEQTYSDWQKGMEYAEKMKPGKERLSLERSLKDAIIAFQKQVEALVPKNSF